MFDEEPEEGLPVPVGYADFEREELRGSAEYAREDGLGILTVCLAKAPLGEKSKQELLARLIGTGILKQCDTELPPAQLSVFEEEEEMYELDIVLADEDYVYAECMIPLPLKEV